MAKKDDTSVNFDYYQVTIFGYEDEPEVVIAADKEEARAEAKAKYGDKMIKSVVRVSGYDLSAEPGEAARKQFYGNLQALSGDFQFKLSEEAEKDTMTVYHTSFEPVKKHGNTPMWFSHSKQQAAGWHKNSLENNDSAHTHQATIKGKIAHYKDPKVRHILQKHGLTPEDYADDLVSNPDADEVMNHPATKVLMKHGYVGHTHSDYDPHDFQKDHDSTVVFNPQKHATHNGRVPPKELKPYMEESVQESRTLKTLASRYITNRKNYKAAHKEVKKGGNVHDVARKYHNVDTKELQSMSEIWGQEHDTSNPLVEGEDKLLYLARIGLMDKNEVLLLKRALEVKRSGQPMSVKNRDILLKLMEKLVAMITSSPHMFNRARHRVLEDVMNEYGDRVVAEQWVQLSDYLEEAGYMDPPRTKAEVKKRYPNIETDVKNKNSRDLQPVRFK